MPAHRRFWSVFAVALLLVAAGCGSESGDEGALAGPTSTTTVVVAQTASSLVIGEPRPVPPSSPGVTVSVPTQAPVPRRMPVSGFGEVAYRIQGSPAQRCALLAESDSQHARGLMNRTDLAGYDGMLFVFRSDTTSSFWMKDTVMSLSIAWFRADGRLVSSTDMEPCVTATCPVYEAAGPYRYALEVQKGGLGALGIGPGSVISVGGACT